jgi:hypothetical protein
MMATGANLVLSRPAVHVLAVALHFWGALAHVSSDVVGKDPVRDASIRNQTGNVLTLSLG